MKSKKITDEGYLDVPDFYSKFEDIKLATDAMPDCEKRPIASLMQSHFDQEWEHILQKVAIRSHSSDRQKKDMRYAIELLITHDTDRANFWKHYLPYTDKVIPKRGSKEVALALFFHEVVIVEFAPTDQAAYFYNKKIFTAKVENCLLAYLAVRGWKSKVYTCVVPKVTHDDGTFYHKGFWQKKLASYLDRLIGE